MSEHDLLTEKVHEPVGKAAGLGGFLGAVFVTLVLAVFATYTDHDHLFAEVT